MSTRPDRGTDRDEFPDPALFWRWVGRATRPVIGWILVLIGVVMILIGYHGLSHQVLVAKQLPYLISGGILGIAVVAVGVLFIGTEEIRRDSGRLDRLELMVSELHAVLLSRPDAPQPASDAASDGSASARLLALPDGERYHSETCRVVAGKAHATPVDLRAIQARGLTPCPLCEPIAVSG